MAITLVLDPAFASVLPSAKNLYGGNAENASLNLPDELGKVEESYRSNSGKTVIYIQDAHDSFEAQNNIAKMIHFFVEQESVKTVFEEGLEGKVPSDEYFGFINDPEIKQKVSYLLMDRLRLGGAEYAHINRTLNFDLIGIDDIKLHHENVEAYRESSQYVDDNEKDLSAIEKKIRKLAHQHFSKELKEWMKYKDRFHREELSLFDYLKRTQQLFLKTVSLETFQAHYPTLALLFAAEQSKNQNVIDRVHQTMDYKAVFYEIHRLEDEYALSHLKEDPERRIFQYYKIIQLLQKLNQIELTSEEYEAVKETLKTFDTRQIAEFIVDRTRKPIALSKRWEENIKSAVRFYDLALLRDRKMEARIDHFLKAPGEETAILIFGGFHKESIKAILREKNISYHIVTPKITSVSARHQEYYRELMASGYELKGAIANAALAAVQPKLYHHVGNPSQAPNFLADFIAEQADGNAIYAGLADQILVFARQESRSDETASAIQEGQFYRTKKTGTVREIIHQDGPIFKVLYMPAPGSPGAIELRRERERELGPRIVNKDIELVQYQEVSAVLAQEEVRAFRQILDVMKEKNILAKTTVTVIQQVLAGQPIVKLARALLTAMFKAEIMPTSEVVYHYMNNIVPHWKKILDEELRIKEKEPEQLDFAKALHELMIRERNKLHDKLLQKFRKEIEQKIDRNDIASAKRLVTEFKKLKIQLHPERMSTLDEEQRLLAENPELYVMRRAQQTFFDRLPLALAHGIEEMENAVNDAFKNLEKGNLEPAVVALGRAGRAKGKLIQILNQEIAEVRYQKKLTLENVNSAKKIVVKHREVITKFNEALDQKLKGAVAANQAVRRGDVSAAFSDIEVNDFLKLLQTLRQQGFERIASHYETKFRQTGPRSESRKKDKRVPYGSRFGRILYHWLSNYEESAVIRRIVLSASLTSALLAIAVQPILLRSLLALSAIGTLSFYFSLRHPRFLHRIRASLGSRNSALWLAERDDPYAVDYLIDMAYGNRERRVIQTDELELFEALQALYRIKDSRAIELFMKVLEYRPEDVQPILELDVYYKSRIIAAESLMALELDFVQLRALESILLHAFESGNIPRLDYDRYMRKLTQKRGQLTLSVQEASFLPPDESKKSGPPSDPRAESRKVADTLHDIQQVLRDIEAADIEVILHGPLAYDEQPAESRLSLIVTSPTMDPRAYKELLASAFQKKFGASLGPIVYSQRDVTEELLRWQDYGAEDDRIRWIISNRKIRGLKRLMNSPRRPAPIEAFSLDEYQEERERENRRRKFGEAAVKKLWELENGSVALQAIDSLQNPLFTDLHRKLSFYFIRNVRELVQFIIEKPESFNEWFNQREKLVLLNAVVEAQSFIDVSLLQTLIDLSGESIPIEFLEYLIFDKFKKGKGKNQSVALAKGEYNIHHLAGLKQFRTEHPGEYERIFMDSEIRKFVDELLSGQEDFENTSRAESRVLNTVEVVKVIQESLKALEVSPKMQLILYGPYAEDRQDKKSWLHLTLVKSGKEPFGATFERLSFDLQQKIRTPRIDFIWADFQLSEEIENWLKNRDESYRENQLLWVINTEGFYGLKKDGRGSFVMISPEEYEVDRRSESRLPDGEHQEGPKREVDHLEMPDRSRTRTAQSHAIGRIMAYLQSYEGLDLGEAITAEDLANAFERLNTGISVNAQAAGDVAESIASIAVDALKESQSSEKIRWPAQKLRQTRIVGIHPNPLHLKVRLEWKSTEDGIVLKRFSTRFAEGILANAVNAVNDGVPFAMVMPKTKNGITASERNLQHALTQSRLQAEPVASNLRPDMSIENFVDGKLLARAGVKGGQLSGAEFEILASRLESLIKKGRFLQWVMLPAGENDKPFDPSGHYRKLIDEAHRKGVQAFLSVSGNDFDRDRLDALLDPVLRLHQPQDILSLNLEQMARILVRLPETGFADSNLFAFNDEELSNAALAILEAYNLRGLLIMRGPAGLMYVHRGVAVGKRVYSSRIPILRASAKAVAEGTFLAELVEGYGYHQSVAVANLYASIASSSNGDLLVLGESKPDFFGKSTKEAMDRARRRFDKVNSRVERILQRFRNIPGSRVGKALRELDSKNKQWAIDKAHSRFDSTLHHQDREGDVVMMWMAWAMEYVPDNYLFNLFDSVFEDREIVRYPFLAALPLRRIREWMKTYPLLRYFLPMINHLILKSYDQLKDQFLIELGIAARLHDLGKSKWKDFLFTKQELNEEEKGILWESMVRHPDEGFKIISEDLHEFGQMGLSMRTWQRVLRAVLEHHENVDGTGYPDKLARLSISVYGLLLRIVDTFDAVTAPRSYQNIKTVIKRDFGLPDEQLDQSSLRELMYLLIREMGDQNDSFYEPLWLRSFLRFISDHGDWLEEIYQLLYDPGFFQSSESGKATEEDSDGEIRAESRIKKYQARRAESREEKALTTIRLAGEKFDMDPAVVMNYESTRVEPVEANDWLVHEARNHIQWLPEIELNDLFRSRNIRFPAGIRNKLLSSFKKTSFKAALLHEINQSLENKRLLTVETNPNWLRNFTRQDDNYQVAWLDQEGRFYTLARFYQYLNDITDDDERARIAAAFFARLLTPKILIQILQNREVPFDPVTIERILQTALAMESFIKQPERFGTRETPLAVEPSWVEERAAAFVYQQRWERNESEYRTMKPRIDWGARVWRLKELTDRLYRLRTKLESQGTVKTADRSELADIQTSFKTAFPMETADEQRLINQSLHFNFQELQDFRKKFESAYQAKVNQLNDTVKRRPSFASETEFEAELKILNRQTVGILKKLIWADFSLVQAILNRKLRSREAFSLLAADFENLDKELKWERVHEQQSKGAVEVFTRSAGDDYLRVRALKEIIDRKRRSGIVERTEPRWVQEETYFLASLKALVASLMDPVAAVTSEPEEWKRKLVSELRRRKLENSTIAGIADEEIGTDDLAAALYLNQDIVPAILGKIKSWTNEKGMLEKEKNMKFVVSLISDLLPDYSGRKQELVKVRYENLFNFFRSRDHVLESYDREQRKAWQAIGYLNDVLMQLRGHPREKISEIQKALIRQDLEQVQDWVRRAVSAEEKLKTQEITKAALINLEAGQYPLVIANAERALALISNEFLTRIQRMSFHVARHRESIRSELERILGLLRAGIRNSERRSFGKALTRLKYFKRDYLEGYITAEEEPGYRNAKTDLTKAIDGLSEALAQSRLPSREALEPVLRHILWIRHDIEYKYEKRRDMDPEIREQIERQVHAQAASYFIRSESRRPTSISKTLKRDLATAMTALPFALLLGFLQNDFPIWQFVPAAGLALYSSARILDAISSVFLKRFRDRWLSSRGIRFQDLQGADREKAEALFENHVWARLRMAGTSVMSFLKGRYRIYDPASRHFDPKAWYDWNINTRIWEEMDLAALRDQPLKGRFLYDWVSEKLRPLTLHFDVAEIILPDESVEPEHVSLIRESLLTTYLMPRNLYHTGRIGNRPGRWMSISESETLVSPAGRRVPVNIASLTREMPGLVAGGFSSGLGTVFLFKSFASTMLSIFNSAEAVAEKEKIEKQLKALNYREITDQERSNARFWRIYQIVQKMPQVYGQIRSEEIIRDQTVREELSHSDVTDFLSRYEGKPAWQTLVAGKEAKGDEYLRILFRPGADLSDITQGLQTEMDYERVFDAIIELEGRLQAVRESEVPAFNLFRVDGVDHESQLVLDVIEQLIFHQVTGWDYWTAPSRWWYEYFSKGLEDFEAFNQELRQLADAIYRENFRSHAEREQIIEARRRSESRGESSESLTPEYPWYRNSKKLFQAAMRIGERGEIVLPTMWRKRLAQESELSPATVYSMARRYPETEQIIRLILERYLYDKILETMISLSEQDSRIFAQAAASEIGIDVATFKSLIEKRPEIERLFGLRGATDSQREERSQRIREFQKQWVSSKERELQEKIQEFDAANDPFRRRETALRGEALRLTQQETNFARITLRSLGRGAGIDYNLVARGNRAPQVADLARNLITHARRAVLLNAMVSILIQGDGQILRSNITKMTGTNRHTLNSFLQENEDINLALLDASSLSDADIPFMVSKLKAMYRKSIEQITGKKNVEIGPDDWEQIREIRRREAGFRERTDEELQKEGRKLLETVREDGVLNEERGRTALALFSEVIYRTLQIRASNEQILAAMKLYSGGRSLQQDNGEGKTLSIALAAYVAALTGKGVHIHTFNDHLAERDAMELAPAFQFLGLSVGVLRSSMRPYYFFPAAAGREVEILRGRSGRQAYQADVTYGISSQFVFDYLEDEWKTKNSRARLQRLNPPYLALIDEADSILIDEAFTSHTIAAGNFWNIDAPAETLAPQYEFFYRKALDLIPSQHYAVQLSHEWISIDSEILRQIQDDPQVAQMKLSPKKVEALLVTALTAKEFYQRDFNYIVDRNRIIIVDELTGRPKQAMIWEGFLHPMLVVKERVENGERVFPPRPIRSSNSMLAYSYYQSLPRIGAISGTILDEEDAFRSLYELETQAIPATYRSRRTEYPFAAFENNEALAEAVAEKVAEYHRQEIPMLVIANSIHEAERISATLLEKNLSHRLLTGKNEEIEDQIIQKAGLRKAITVSTPMVGRGTDIVPETGVENFAGILVGLDPNLRVHKQRRGRLGRQGRQSVTYAFYSLEDPLIKRFSKMPEVRTFLDSFAEQTPDQHAAFAAWLIKTSETTIKNRRLALRWINEVISSSRKRLHRIREDEKDVKETVLVSKLHRVWRSFLNRLFELRYSSEGAETFETSSAVTLSKLLQREGLLDMESQEEALEMSGDPHVVESPDSEIAANLGLELLEMDGVKRIRYPENYQRHDLSINLVGIAHGTTDNNLRRVLHGARTNNEASRLNEQGRKEAQAGAEKLWSEIGRQWQRNPEDFVFLMTPALRTHDTSQIYQNYFRQQSGKSFDPQIDREASEIDFGLYDGLTAEEIKKQYGSEAANLVKRYRSSDVTVAFEQGENYLDLLARGREWLKHVDERFPGKTVIVFGHLTFLGGIDVLLRTDRISFDSEGLIEHRATHFPRGLPHVFYSTAKRAEMREANEEEKIEAEFHRLRKALLEALQKDHEISWQYSGENIEAIMQAEEFDEDRATINVSIFPAPEEIQKNPNLGMLQKHDPKTRMGFKTGSFGLIGVSLTWYNGSPKIVFLDRQPTIGYQNLVKKSRSRDRRKYKAWVKSGMLKVMETAQSIGIDQALAIPYEKILQIHNKKRPLWKEYYGFTEVFPDETVTDIYVILEADQAYDPIDGFDADPWYLSKMPSMEFKVIDYEMLRAMVKRSRSESRNGKELAEELRTRFPKDAELMLGMFGDLLMQDPAIKRWFDRIIRFKRGTLTKERAFYFASLLKLDEGFGFKEEDRYTLRYEIEQPDGSLKFKAIAYTELSDEFLNWAIKKSISLEEFPKAYTLFLKKKATLPQDGKTKVTIRPGRKLGEELAQELAAIKGVGVALKAPLTLFKGDVQDLRDLTKIEIKDREKAMQIAEAYGLNLDHIRLALSEREGEYFLHLLTSDSGFIASASRVIGERLGNEVAGAFAQLRFYEGKPLITALKSLFLLPKIEDAALSQQIEGHIHLLLHFVETQMAEIAGQERDIQKVRILTAGYQLQNKRLAEHTAFRYYYEFPMARGFNLVDLEEAIEINQFAKAWFVWEKILPSRSESREKEPEELKIQLQELRAQLEELLTEKKSYDQELAEYSNELKKMVEEEKQMPAEKKSLLRIQRDLMQAQRELIQEQEGLIEAQNELINDAIQEGLDLLNEGTELFASLDENERKEYSAWFFKYLVYYAVNSHNADSTPDMLSGRTDFAIRQMKKFREDYAALISDVPDLEDSATQLIEIRARTERQRKKEQGRRRGSRGGLTYSLADQMKVLHAESGRESGVSQTKKENLRQFKPHKYEGEESYRAGNEVRDRGQFTEAIEHYQSAAESIRKHLEEHPEDSGARHTEILNLTAWAVALNHLAKKHHGEKALSLYKEAVDLTERVLSQDAGNQFARDQKRTALNAMGLIYNNKGNRAGSQRDDQGALSAYEQALDYFREAQTVDPGNAVSQDQARNVLEKLGNAHERQGFLLSRSGDHAAGLEQYHQAVRYFEEAIKAGAKSKELVESRIKTIGGIGIVKNAMATADRKNGYLEPAETKYNEAIEILEEVKNLHPNRGLIAKQLVSAYTGIGILFSKKADSLRQKSSHREAIGFYEKALTYFNKALALEPQSKITSDQLGNAINGLEYSRRFVENVPEPVMGWNEAFQQAKTHLASENLEEALTVAKQALELLEATDVSKKGDKKKRLNKLIREIEGKLQGGPGNRSESRGIESFSGNVDEFRGRIIGLFKRHSSRDLLYQETLRGIMEKSELVSEDGFKKLVLEGRTFAEISEYGTLRFFDSNGRWILGIDRFGNKTDELFWNSDGVFESAETLNGNGDWISLNAGNDGLVRTAGIQETEETVYTFFPGVDFNAVDRIPYAEIEPVSFMRTSGVGHAVFRLIAYLAKDQARALTYRGGNNDEFIPSDRLFSLFAEIARFPDNYPEVSPFAREPNNIAAALHSMMELTPERRAFRLHAKSIHWSPAPAEMAFNPKSGIYFTVRDNEIQRVFYRARFYLVREYLFGSMTDPRESRQIFKEEDHWVLVDNEKPIAKIDLDGNLLWEAKAPRSEKRNVVPATPLWFANISTTVNFVIDAKSIDGLREEEWLEFLGLKLLNRSKLRILIRDETGSHYSERTRELLDLGEVYTGEWHPALDDGSATVYFSEFDRGDPRRFLGEEIRKLVESENGDRYFGIRFGNFGAALIFALKDDHWEALPKRNGLYDDTYGLYAAEVGDLFRFYEIISAAA